MNYAPARLNKTLYNRSRNDNTVFNRKAGFFEYQKSKYSVNVIINPLLPAEIIDTVWTDLDEPDIVKYRAVSGNIFIIQDENLLKEICKSSMSGDKKLKAPYLHFRDSEGWICLPKPQKGDVLQFLKKSFLKYDIYTEEGSPVRECSNSMIIKSEHGAEHDRNYI